MVEINNYSLPPEFPNGKNETKEKFIELVLKKAPKINSFCIHKIANELELNDIEKRQFSNLKYEIRNELILGGLAILIKPNQNDLILTEKGKNYFEKKTNNPIMLTQNIDQYIGGDNYGIQSSKSDLKSPITQNINPTKAKEPIKKSALEILSWICGIIATAIVVYEFIIKKI